uniref:Copper transport protein n=1 Tax=Glossina pallidipes TaxID=7398 RepID=A0A1A9ZKT7_GLOPL
MDHSQHTLHSNHDHLMHPMHTATERAMDQQMMSTTTSSADMHMHHSTMHHSGHSMDEIGGGRNMGSDNMHMMHSMMSMSFHFGCNEIILFDFWKVTTVWGMVGSAIAVFILALLYEGLKYYREYLFWKTYNLLEYRPVTAPQTSAESGNRSAVTPQNSAARVQYVGEVIHKQPPSMLSLSHLYQTFLHMVQVTVSFFLMLIFMTYNVWLCMAVVLGAGLGYFLFCWKKSVIVDKK